MIYPDDIEPLEHHVHPVDPPRKPGFPERIPPVDRIPPELPVLTEVIGRHPGNGERAPFCVQVEEMLVRPHVGAVMVDVDRQVADDLYPPGAASAPPTAA